MKKPTTTRRARGTTADADPYKPARRPVRVEAGARPARGDRPLRSGPPRGFDRAERPARSFDRAERPARSFDRAERPARSFDRSERPARPRPPRDSDSAPRYGARRFGDEDRAAPRGDRGPGFTVNLDPDVARVFRGDASVNKALRLVIQMMQVVQGPPPRPAGEGGRGFAADRPPRPSGYRGTPEARGFERKPKFEESDEE